MGIWSCQWISPQNMACHLHQFIQTIFYCCSWAFIITAFFYTFTKSSLQQFIEKAFRYFEQFFNSVYIKNGACLRLTPLDVVLCRCELQGVLCDVIRGAIRTYSNHTGTEHATAVGQSSSPKHIAPCHAFIFLFCFYSLCHSWNLALPCKKHTSCATSPFVANLTCKERNLDPCL